MAGFEVTFIERTEELKDGGGFALSARLVGWRE